jgi:hypothetical protein
MVRRRAETPKAVTAFAMRLERLYEGRFSEPLGREGAP